MQAVFIKKHRFALLDRLSREYVRSSLEHYARQHLGERKQMACFAFDHIGREITIEGAYEAEQLDTLFEWLPNYHADIFNGAAIDIGANIGNHTLYFSDHFKKVYSFEPNKRAFQLLSINADLASNIESYNIGLSDDDGIALLDVNPRNLGGATITRNASATATAIHVRTLDSVIKESDLPIKFVKVDVEGHELQVLAGARATLERNRPVVVFEQAEAEMRDGTSPVIELLRDYGYTRFMSIEPLRSWDAHNSTGLPRLVKRSMNLIYRYAFGHRLAIVERDVFERKYYGLIIALPATCVRQEAD